MEDKITNNETQNHGIKKALVKMLIGGIIGFLLFFGLCYLWMIYKNNVNPVSGPGALVISFFGLVVGHF
jgi:ABC-type antimicrobial peptide transport system permease subunit